MIRIIEIPHQLPASLWEAEDEKDLIDRVTKTHGCGRSGQTLWEETTARELLASESGMTPEQADADPDVPNWISDLASKNGWHTPIVRADYELSEGEYIPATAAAAQGITEYTASLAYIGHDLNSMLLYETDEAAADALAQGGAPGDAPTGDFARHQGVEARALLRKSLLIDNG